MYNNAETGLGQAIGSWSTVAQLLIQDTSKASGRSRETIDLTSSKQGQFTFPGQCQALLTSDEPFVIFVEQWEVSHVAEPAVGQSPINLINKKVYPAKINGINLPLPNFLDINSNPNLSVTVRWKEGLIGHGNYLPPSQYHIQIDYYRPGFGEVIADDLNRPLQSKTVQCNNLGLKIDTTFQAGRTFEGPLGRLMACASYIDPKLADLYDASKKKKKKVPLNEQDIEENPTFPTYTAYNDNSGY